MNYEKMTNEQLSQKMYDFIQDNVNNGEIRYEMYELLDQFEERMEH